MRVSAQQGGMPPGENPEWDPEKLFTGTSPKEGIIARRMMQKRIEKDKDFAAQVRRSAAELTLRCTQPWFKNAQ